MGGRQSDREFWNGKIGIFYADDMSFLVVVTNLQLQQRPEKNTPSLSISHVNGAPSVKGSLLAFA